MEIVINLAKSESGRLAGTLRTPGTGDSAQFDGTMELLAALERVCDVDDRPQSP